MHIKAKDLVCIARSIPIHHSFYPQQFVPYTKTKNICSPVAKPKLWSVDLDFILMRMIFYTYIAKQLLQNQKILPLTNYVTRFLTLKVFE